MRYGKEKKEMQKKHTPETPRGSADLFKDRTIVF